MKANWKIALMCLAMFAMVACKDKNQPSSGSGSGQTSEQEQPGEEGEDIFDYINPIEVNDQSVEDWDKLDQSKVAVANLSERPLYEAIKQLKVYADSVCIYYMLVLNPAELPSHTDVDAMHIYMDADNSDETGGYWDQFDEKDKGNTDLMFEGPVWDADGNQISYAPSVSYWNGPLNGEGWLWAEQPVSNKVSASQFVGDSIIEGRLAIELIPYKNWKDKFSIGFDIQQNFESVGLIPQGNTPEGTLIGRSKKLLVTFDK